MQMDSNAEKMVRQVLRGDRAYTTILSVCWAVTILAAATGGALFTLFGIGFFFRMNETGMAASGAMACACTVVPYIASRSIEGFARARVLERLAEELDDRRKAREGASESAQPSGQS